MSAPVFLCPAVADARVGDVLVLEGPEGHHASQVRRMSPGEAVDLIDGHGARASGVVLTASAGRVEVRVDAVSRDIDQPLVLVQALAKGGRDESAVEAATELGITRVIPWAASRSVVKWEGRKVMSGRERWATVALSAAKVARRAVVPEIEQLVTTPELAALVSEAVSAGAVVLLLHEEATTGIAERVGDGASGEVWIVVGPEGGIPNEEASSLAAAGALPTRLGPYVLRSGTAGPAAAAALSALTGAWTPPAEGAGALG